MGIALVTTSVKQSQALLKQRGVAATAPQLVELKELMVNLLRKPRPTLNKITENMCNALEKIVSAHNSGAASSLTDDEIKQIGTDLKGLLEKTTKSGDSDALFR